MTAAITYILPLRAGESLASSELTAYLQWVAARAELIVVDGSEPEVFSEHARAWSGLARHVAPDADLTTPMGKVGGVLTGVRLASHEHIVIADDDVRYDDEPLSRVSQALDDADVVRPQNYFVPLPWHARWDTGRTLLNRMTGGDWPGTLGVRRSILRRTGGYDGRAMFENLELVRTVQAAGGREVVLLDVFVARRPSSSAHFWSQRIRQAYDEIARPGRLFAQLAVLPLASRGIATSSWWSLAGGVAVVIGVAELGRRRARGKQVFPFTASLMAPLWLAERAVCSWLALASRVAFGGVRYRGRVLRHAATPMRELLRRHSASPAAPVELPAPAPRHQSA